MELLSNYLCVCLVKSRWAYIYGRGSQRVKLMWSRVGAKTLQRCRKTVEL